MLINLPYHIQKNLRKQLFFPNNFIDMFYISLATEQSINDSELLHISYRDMIQYGKNTLAFKKLELIMNLIIMGDNQKYDRKSPLSLKSSIEKGINYGIPLFNTVIKVFKDIMHVIMYEEDDAESFMFVIHKIDKISKFNDDYGQSNAKKYLLMNLFYEYGHGSYIYSSVDVYPNIVESYINYIKSNIYIDPFKFDGSYEFIKHYFTLNTCDIILSHLLKIKKYKIMYDLRTIYAIHNKIVNFNCNLMKAIATALLDYKMMSEVLCHTEPIKYGHCNVESTNMIRDHFKNLYQIKTTAISYQTFQNEIEYHFGTYGITKFNIKILETDYWIKQFDSMDDLEKIICISLFTNINSLVEKLKAYIETHQYHDVKPHYCTTRACYMHFKSETLTKINHVYTQLNNKLNYFRTKTHNKKK